MPDFVQKCATVNKLRAINKIQNSGRRHLKFLIFVHFSQMVCFRWQPSTLLQNFIHLRQSAAELSLFVQKSKMAAVAILNYNFVMLDHSRSAPEIPLQISCWSTAHFSRYRDSKISQSWLKMLTQAPKIMFLGSFEPQKAPSYVKTRVLSHKRSWSLFCCDLLAWARIQKKQG